MMNRPGMKVATFLLASAASLTAQAQDNASAPYRPLFTEEMITKAAPSQRDRMRDAEEINRRAYERRKEAAEQAAAEASAAQAPAVPRPRPRRKKIYKWVDDRGRVNFGDAPAGKGAQEITIKTTAPPPPPSDND